MIILKGCSESLHPVCIVCHESQSKQKTMISQIGRNYLLQMKMREENHKTTIASKISRADKQKLHAIADYLGMTFYQLVQSILMTIVRYWDRGGLLTAEHYTMIDAFATVLKSSVGSYSPISARDSGNDHITSAILLVERKAGQRPQLMEIHKDSAGNVIESYNYDTMLAAFLNAIDPDCLQRLEDEAKELGYFSITHALCEILLKCTARTEKDIMRTDIAELFSDERITTGQKVNNDTLYRQKYNIGDYTTPTAHKETYRTDI